jgi:hypothetical protein
MFLPAPSKRKAWLLGPCGADFFRAAAGAKDFLKKATYTNDTHLSMRIFQALTRNHNGTHMTGTHPTRTHRTHPAAPHVSHSHASHASQSYSSHPNGKHPTSTHPAGTHPAHTHSTHTHRTGTKIIRSSRQGLHATAGRSACQGAPGMKKIGDCE